MLPIRLSSCAARVAGWLFGAVRGVGGGGVTVVLAVLAAACVSPIASAQAPGGNERLGRFVPAPAPPQAWGAAVNDLSVAITPLSGVGVVDAEGRFLVSFRNSGRGGALL